MEKDILTLSYTLVIEIDKRVVNTKKLGEALEKGFATIISSDVNLSSETFGVCEDEDILNDAEHTILNALKEQG